MAKSKYDKNNFPLLAESYARKGASDKDICKRLGISQDTFYTYVKKYPEFSEALKKGKAPVDFQVENALLKRALGYDFEEVVTEYVNEEGIRVIKSQKKTTKHMAADISAGIFWLTNRNNKDWKRNRDIQKIQVSEVQDEAIVKKEIARLLKEKMKTDK